MPSPSYRPRPKLNKKTSRVRRSAINPSGKMFTPALRAGICLSLAKGATHRIAAELAGVEERSMKRWLAYGRENHRERDAWYDGDQSTPRPKLNEYGRFVLEVEAAKAKVDIEATCCFAAAAKKDWRAAAAWLERRRPHEFGEVVAVSATGIDPETGDKTDYVGELIDRIAKQARRVVGDEAEADVEAATD